MITCKFEAGNPAELRHVTVIGLVMKEGKLLLAKRSDKMRLEAGKWGPPGGFLDRGETVIEGVKRELLEETGYSAEVVCLFRINSNPGRPKELERQNVDIIFMFDGKEKVGEPDDETAELKWFELDALPSEDQFAFDHYASVQLLIKHLNEPLDLPILD